MSRAGLLKKKKKAKTSHPVVPVAEASAPIAGTTTVAPTDAGVAQTVVESAAVAPVTAVGA